MLDMFFIHATHAKDEDMLRCCPRRARFSVMPLIPSMACHTIRHARRSRDDQ
jgi:hypothetical protein